jgi:hypothetical protein
MMSEPDESSEDIKEIDPIFACECEEILVAIDAIIARARLKV